MSKSQKMVQITNPAVQNSNGLIKKMQACPNCYKPDLSLYSNYCTNCGTQIAKSIIRPGEKQ